MNKAWAMTLVAAAVMVTACSGSDSTDPTSAATTASTESTPTASTSAAPSSAGPAEGDVMWDLSVAPGGWGFVRPEYSALAVYRNEAGTCTGTFDTVQLLPEPGSDTPPPSDSDSTLDTALDAFVAKAGLAADEVETAPLDPLDVPLTGTEEEISLVGRSVTTPDAVGVAYGRSDAVLALSVVVLCTSADVDDPEAEIADFLSSLALVEQVNG